jgi:hypothetical protein
MHAMLMVLLSLSITGLFVIASGPAQATTSCSVTNLGTSRAPEWQRACRITGLPASVGATFDGAVYWDYAGDVTQAESGLIDGTVADTVADGHCAAVYELYRETKSAPVAYKFLLNSDCNGKGTSDKFSCSFNRTSGCTPVLNDTSGYLELEVCAGSNCTIFWRQTMQNGPPT